MACDVAVLGSGPAGSTAARLLARWGHAVLLIAPGSARAPLAESLPPSTARILDEVGVLGPVDAAGFVRTSGNTSWWGSEETRSERFEGGAQGWQVLRADLESVMRRAALDAGVAWREGRATAAPPEARHVIDASGRSGVLASRFRVPHGPATLAVSAAFARPGGFDVPDDSHTLVESHDGGWAWSVPVAPGLRHVTAMLDRPAPGATPRDPEALFARGLDGARRMRALLEGARRQGPAWAADASAYTSRRFADGRVTLAGDAASFIDPLSSFGVKKALFSGWLAAVAVHTMLRRPDRTDVAAAYYSRQERRVFARYAGEAARHAAEAARRHPGSRFWSARAGVAVPPDAEPPLATEGEVRAAFDALRSQQSLSLRLAPDVRVGTAPAVEGNEIVDAEALVDARGRSVAHLDGVSAPGLARLLSETGDVGRLCEAHLARHPGTPLGDVLRALATLVAAGLLRHDAGRRG